MTKIEALNIIYELFSIKNNWTNTIKTLIRNPMYKNVKLFICNYINENKTFSEKVYIFIHNKREFCKNCGKETGYINFMKGYSSYCSNKCSNSSDEVKIKIKKTMLKKYGVEHALQSKIIHDKQKSTCIKKFGVSSNFKLAKTRENIKQTWIDKYGVDNPLKSNSIKEKAKQTNLKKYGVEVSSKSENVKQKVIKRNNEKYGVDYPNKLECVKEKIKQTNLKNLGVEIPIQSKDIKSKIEQTNLKNLGVKNPFSSKIVQEKIKQTNLKKYGAENPAKSPIVKEKTRKTLYNRLLKSNRLINVIPMFGSDEYKGTDILYKFKCKKCNNIFESHLNDGRIPRCYICNPIISDSLSEKENQIYFYLVQKFKIKYVIKNDRSVLCPLELDIYLPDYNLAIEFDGLYWHSECGQNKNKNYHINKTELCQEKGIQLIHIFEDEWIEKEEIVKSIIKNKLGMIENRIYARNCKVKIIPNEDYELFLINNHIQGSIKAKYKIGLYYNNELVQLCSFSKSRYNKEYEYELIRSCSKINTSIVGGFDRLVKYFIKTYNCKSLISYVDRRYFDGSGYKNWNCAGITKPNYYYMKNYQTRESRLKYQKHKLQKLFPEHYDSDLTEWQIMQLAGYDRIWDCGNLVFECKKKLMSNKEEYHGKPRE